MRPGLAGTGGHKRTPKEETSLTTASLRRMVRDHRTGEVHIPHETVAILGITKNLGRTLFKVKWQAGGDSVLLADDLAGCLPTETADTGSLSSLRAEKAHTKPAFRA